jgi:S-adenosyl methyltransferase
VIGDWPGDVPLEPDEYPRLDVNVAHPARIYNAWLGGKDNFAVDRMAAGAGMQAFPSIVQSVRANRAFLARTVTHLTAEAGIRQFLDIGTGLPMAGNTHEIAQAIAPECRVAYVDYDPIVLMHSQVLLTSTEDGATGYIDADLRDPEKILNDAARVLDFSRPVAIMLFSVLQFIADDESPRQIVRTLMDAVAPGSYLTVAHLAKDIFPGQMAAFAAAVNAHSVEKIALRDMERVSRFFDGLEFVEPGVVQVSRWRPRSDQGAAAPTVFWGGVARKPR